MIERTFHSTPTPDVEIENHGTLYLFHLLTGRALDWTDEHIEEPATYFGDALVVEHRYARDLAEGMVGDGLRVQ